MLNQTGLSFYSEVYILFGQGNLLNIGGHLSGVKAVLCAFLFTVWEWKVAFFVIPWPVVVANWRKDSFLGLLHNLFCFSDVVAVGSITTSNFLEFFFYLSLFFHRHHAYDFKPSHFVLGLWLFVLILLCLRRGYATDWLPFLGSACKCDNCTYFRA